MRVLIADDDAATRFLLADLIASWGYQVETASDGAEAWRAMESPTRPPIAVLDWMMPELDGLEVCRRIKRHSPPYTYVILLTARQSKEDIVAGLDAGADDYIRKPVDASELESRLFVGVRTTRYEEALEEKNRQLERYAEEMERLAMERARQLVHSERLATLGQLAAGIVHEINNPLGYISGNSQMLRRYWEVLRETLAAARAAGVEVPTRVDMIDQEMPQVLDAIHGGVERIQRLAKGLRRHVRRTDEPLAPVDINACVEQSLLICENRLKYNIATETDLDTDLPTATGRGQELEQILVNLLVNAADALEEVENGRIRVRTAREGSHVRIEVENNGPSIPPEAMRRIWEPFFTTKGEDRGTGLGLAIVRGIVDEHQGEITAANLETGGVRFTLHLPIDGAAAEQARDATPGASADLTPSS